MTYLPQPVPNGRATRLRLAEITPAVLRFQDGFRTQGHLEVVSVTGGLLRIAKPLSQGSQVKLMFVTQAGPVSGAAEMLSAITWNQQPFRFVGLEEDDHRRLRTAIHSFPGQNRGEQEWIDKYRAAVVQGNRPRRRLFRVLAAAVALATLCLGCAIYVLKLYR
jgi:hypothetical protein